MKIMMPILEKQLASNKCLTKTCSMSYNCTYVGTSLHNTTPKAKWQTLLLFFYELLLNKLLYIKLSEVQSINKKEKRKINYELQALTLCFQGPKHENM